MTELDYESLSDSQRVRLLMADERLRGLEGAHDALGKRIGTVESWPQRALVAFVGGTLAMAATIIGCVWYLGSTVATLTARINALERTVNLLDERAWQRRTAPEEE